MNEQLRPEVAAFFDAATSTFSYVVHAAGSAAAVIIDPVLDYEPCSGSISTGSAEKLCAYLSSRSLRAEWILETHAHADHLSAADWLRRQLPNRPRLGIGRGITSVQATFKKLLSLEDELAVDGRQFDQLLDAGTILSSGSWQVQVLATPGHTCDSVSYLIGDAVFIGDTMFMPDYGTARCDFPGGDARTLYRSIRQLLALPDEFRFFVGHDYPPTDRPPRHQTSSGEQRADNVHIGQGVSEDDFVRMRTQRDLTLHKPVLLWPAVQVNIRAGALPPADAAGHRFLKVPLSVGQKF
jgi:glyoxylase-like metal-dependent hydrolase (beta-lactamase superfamily II)